MAIVGAVKLKDGIFFGDESAASDVEFLLANKVSRIVNCAGRDVANHFQRMGITYLTYNWSDNDSQIIIDIRGIVVNDFCEFLEEALNEGESVLVHSVRGQSRCITLLTAWLIRQYRWSLNKALEYMQSRQSDIRIKPNFHRQLLSFERRTILAGDVLSHGWDFPPSMGDELVLFNTYINSLVGKGPLGGGYKSRTNDLGSSHQPTRLVWRDHHSDDRSKLEQLSNSSGKVYLGNVCPPGRGILKKGSYPVDLGGSISGASTAALSTPVMNPVIMMGRFPTPTRGLLQQSGRLAVSTVRPPSPMLRPTSSSTPIRSPVIASPMISVGSSPVPGPIRVGRSPTLRNPSNHHIRPPSPMVSHSRPQTIISRPPSPSTRSQMRAPSPLRDNLRTAYSPVVSTSGLSLNNESRPLSSNSLISGRSLGGFRRSASPMVESLPGIRPWRTR